jgi:hypothetical protein
MTATVLQIVGAVLVVLGVGAFSVAVAAVVAGLFLLVFGLAVEKGAKR